MSVRRLAEKQPASFEFTPENKAWAEKKIAKYPPGRQASAVIALLWRAQKQSDYWLSKPAIERVADMLDMPKIRVLEVATFYTMFNLEPVGRHYIQLCGTTPCVLRGAEDIKTVLRKRVGAPDHVTPDGLFSWSEVECLGACCNAPMVQINDDYYEDLTPENFAKLLDDLAAGRPVRTGSQIGRVSSEPVGGLTALTSLYGADGKSGGQGAQAPANHSAAGGRGRPVPIDDAAAHAKVSTPEKDAAPSQALSQGSVQSPSSAGTPANAAAPGAQTPPAAIKAAEPAGGARRARIRPRPAATLSPSISTRRRRKPMRTPRKLKSKRRSQSCRPTQRPSRRRTLSAPVRRACRPPAQVRPTICSVSRASARRTRSGCTSSAYSISIRSPPGRCPKFVGSGPISLSPGASIARAGWRRRPASPRAEQA